MKGRLETLTGCMACGKTEELQRRIRRAKIAKQRVVIFNSHVDMRSEKDKVTSRIGLQLDAIEVTVPSEILEKAEQFDVIGIDEVQFFDHDLVEVIERLIDMGKRVIVSGLDTDFRGEPFGIVPYLMAISDDLLRLKAVCMQCGKPAIRTQRIVKGDELIVVGGDEAYEARCRDCYEVPSQIKST
ncbi:thymidine kinase [Patescibacteria group bacterium AH-259-L07]|nr:thymidine kinase [Patescibacteria group bacterium AH-259-L07]